MSYQEMSVKEVVGKINANLNGWFLPPIQRPYVWGSRYESEKFICKLFDSLLRGYPIGGIIVWNNQAESAYKEFLTHYHNDDISEIVDKGLWNRQDKWLVYDGQQRLQTLYSCLKYSINDRFLIYDLFFDIESEREETGFSFCTKNEDLTANFVRMNEIFVCQENSKTQFRKDILKKINLDDTNKETLVEKNIDLLWKIFVTTDVKSIAYFPVESPDETTVNEIFQRLNTGGVPLSRSDLLLSKIKEKQPDFEEDILFFSRDILDKTDGYYINSDQILQLLNLLIRSGIRIAPDKTSSEQLDQFISYWFDSNLREAIKQFYINFLFGEFKINNQAIVPKKLAVYPIIIAFKIMLDKNINYKKLEDSMLTELKRYFILSQINDWDIASIVDNVSKILINSNKNTTEFVFPKEEISKFIQSKNRRLQIAEEIFTSYTWFSLKILTPCRLFNFSPDNKGRYNPEIDHIFPLRGKTDDEYRKAVDIIWNMQPVEGAINNYKRKKAPYEFFTSEDGKKYFSHYDFYPILENDDWKNWKEFIKNRRLKMIDFLNEKYGITFQN